MAYPKVELFPLDDQTISAYGRALGHPARAFMLRTIEEMGPQQVTDFVRMMPLSEGTVCAHISKLMKAGLLDVEIHGLVNLYSLNKVALMEMRQKQLDFFMSLNLDSELVDQETLQEHVGPRVDS